MYLTSDQQMNMQSTAWFDVTQLTYILRSRSLSCYIYQCLIATNFGAADYSYISSRQGLYILGMLNMTCLHFTSYVVRHMRTKPSYQNYVFGQNMKKPAMVRPGIIASSAFTAYSWPSNILSTKDLIEIQKDHS